MEFHSLAFAAHYTLAPRLNLSLQSRCHVRRARTVRCSATRLDDHGNPRPWHDRADWKMESSGTGDEAIDPMSTSSPLFDGQGGSISGSGGGRFSSGGSGGDDESGADLPEDMRMALAKGLLTKEALERYRRCLKDPLMRIALAIPSFRSRFLADSAFAFKLLIQELIGNGTALASEIAVRGKDIVDELEYVASDLIVGSVIEAAFVWLLAPTIRVPVQNAGAVAKYIGSLPSNVFQPSTVVQKFTLGQRCGSFIYAGIQYGVMGFVGGVVGTWITYTLIEIRKRLDKEYKPERPLPAVVPNSAAWGAFLAGSSNTRFQIVEGMELGIARLAGGRAPAMVNGSIVGLRLANNYWGGVQFVQFFRALGLHATANEG